MFGTYKSDYGAGAEAKIQEDRSGSLHFDHDVSRLGMRRRGDTGSASETGTSGGGDNSTRTTEYVASKCIAWGFELKLATWQHESCGIRIIHNAHSIRSLSCVCSLLPRRARVTLDRFGAELIRPHTSTSITLLCCILPSLLSFSSRGTYREISPYYIAIQERYCNAV